MSKINSIFKFCQKCQTETERNARGGCKLCKKAENKAWNAANPERVKASNAAAYAANPERAKARAAALIAANPERAKAYRDAWRAANPERNKSNAIAWRTANPEYAKAYNAAWAAANPDRKKESDAAWRVANPERARASDAAWKAANPERNKANKAAWAKANPEATRLHNQNRRAKSRINGGVLSKGLSAKLFKLQRGKCACCSLPLGDDYHLDHVLPIALGGPNVDDNIQLLRQRCNQQKNAKHPIDFMQQRGFLL